MLDYLEPKRLQWKAARKGQWDVFYMLHRFEPKATDTRTRGVFFHAGLS